MTRRRTGRFRWRSKRLAKPSVLVDLKLQRVDPFTLTPEQWAELENAAANGRYYIKTRQVTREEFAAMFPKAQLPEPK